jgi:hypothetical protein
MKEILNKNETYERPEMESVIIQVSDRILQDSDGNGNTNPFIPHPED